MPPPLLSWWGLVLASVGLLPSPSSRGMVLSSRRHRGGIGEGGRAAIQECAQRKLPGLLHHGRLLRGTLTSPLLKDGSNRPDAGDVQVRLSEHLDSNLWFDLVNCQFALHYAFDSEQRALTYVSSSGDCDRSFGLSAYSRLLRNVSDKLKPGGWFIGSIPNANWIVYLPTLPSRWG